MTSNVYLAKAQTLTTSINQNIKCRNPERTYQALKYIGKGVEKVARAEYVVDLFKDLRKTDTPLRTVTDMCNKMCSDIKSS